MNDTPAGRINREQQPLASFDESKRCIASASRFLPGGVSSNFRLGMIPTPLVIERADGPFLFDVDGNRLIDYYLGMGPMILGHNPEPIRRAVITQLERGLLYGAQSRLEAQVAELFHTIVPCAEKLRFTSSGSEAVQAALRLARAETGRNAVIKFEGHYHGWFDNVLVSVQATPDNAGDPVRPNRNPGSAGQDATAWGNVEVLGWNDLAAVEARLAVGDVAAVIMEPMMCNAGGILPGDGYLQGVREACTRNGTVLIFDEVVTGFRVAAGGAQQLFGVTPDIATFGKCLANGFPVAAVAGRADLLDRFVSGGAVHGGTYNAQPVSMAAALVTLQTLCDGRVIDAIAPLGRRLMTGIASHLTDAGIPAVVSGLPQIFNVSFGLTQPARNYRDLMQVDRLRYVRFCGEMLKRRVRALERGAWFLSATHDEAAIHETLAVIAEAAQEVK